MEKQRIHISQCMIVKNEEKNIEKALSWGKGVVWEQIVVDTGSTDRTVELAKAMGAKVYHFEWIDDFAAAKNFALSKASGDWIAFLDADEYLSKEWAGELLPLLEDLEDSPYHVVRTPLLCVDGEKITAVVRQYRFFRHMPGLCYQNAVHEELSLYGETLPAKCIIDTEEEFPIYHTGYTTENIPRKQERNYKLLRKQLEKDPDSYIIMGYLGNSCPKNDEGRRESEAWYRKAIAHMPEKISPHDDRSALIFINLLCSFADQEREEAEMQEIYELARCKVPWVYDIEYIMSNYYVGKQDYAKAVHYLEKGLQVAEEYGALAYGIYMNKNIAWVWETLAVCHYRTGNIPESLRYCVTLLKEDNRQFKTLHLLLELLKGENPKDTLDFLQNLYDVGRMEDRIFLLRAVLRAQADGILALLWEKCSAEELQYLDRLNQ